jgi:uncharacterized membrane protein
MWASIGWGVSAIFVGYLVDQVSFIFFFLLERNVHLIKFKNIR